MALPYTRSGTFIRSAGIYSALAKQAKLVNLKPVKKITFSFDPFREDALVVRRTLNYFFTSRVRETNGKCALKTNVLCNRADPNIEVKLADGKTILFNTKNLETLEILRKFNEMVSSLAKKEEKVPETSKPKLKSQKRR